MILAVRPGRCGYTHMAFLHEGNLLDPGETQAHYLNGLLPQKVALDRLYAAHRSPHKDLEILGATMVALLFRQPIAVHRRTGALTRRRRAGQSLSKLDH